MKNIFNSNFLKNKFVFGNNSKKLHKILNLKHFIMYICIVVYELINISYIQRSKDIHTPSQYKLKI